MFDYVLNIYYRIDRILFLRSLDVFMRDDITIELEWIEDDLNVISTMEVVSCIR